MRHFATLALACFVLSACGGDEDGESESNQFKRAIEPQAQERAESVLLTSSDFPEGWDTEPADPDDEDSDEAFNDCIGADYSDFTLIGEAESDDFTRGQAARASSEAEVFENEEMASDAIAELTEGFGSDEATTCMNEMLGEFEDEEVEITKAELEELDFTAPPGLDDANGWQIAFTIEGKEGTQSEGASIVAYIDLIQLRSGDTTAEVSKLDVGAPFDPDMRDDLVAGVAGRLAE
jgi:hypothetical protein